jgi:predicted regulator of Ras-like GTPase activity (Roadblock/LC7/MglB family)
MSGQALADEVRTFSWLLNGFVEKTAGVSDAVAVSSDGLLMAMSSTLNRASAEQLAAIISGMVSLGNGASSCFGFDGLEQVIVTMRRGFLFVSSISDGSCLGVVASRACDIGLVGYQTTLLVERAGSVLTPDLVAELKQEMLAT